MFNTLKMAALSLAVGMGALAAAPTGAQAQGIYFELGNGGEIIESDDDYRPRHYRRNEWRRDNWRRDEYRRWERCSPDEAADKARRHGLRKVRVVDVDRRTITIRGRQWGDRQHLVFGRAPNCPLVDRY